MEREWRFSAEQSHAFFVAFWENARNHRMKEYPEFAQNLPVWLETFRNAGRLVVAPARPDPKIFFLVVEQELIRLASFEADTSLECGCTAFQHRQALQQFRLKNLEP